MSTTTWQVTERHETKTGVKIRLGEISWAKKVPFPGEEIDPKAGEEDTYDWEDCDYRDEKAEGFSTGEHWDLNLSVEAARPYVFGSQHLLTIEPIEVAAPVIG